MVIIRILVLFTLLGSLSACRLSRPFRSIVQGDMTMDGDMRMEGDMNMSGQVSTIMRSDNRASRLVSVPVYGESPRELPNAGQSGVRSSPAMGKIAVLDVDGLLVNKNIGGFGSLGENPVALFREKLDAIAADPSITAILLRINSPGGGVTAADIMSRDLLQVKQSRNLPVVACLMDVGTGAGYYLACTADTIVAHPTSIVGGIGVILNAYNMEVAIEQFSIASIPIKAGEHIDIASPEREMQHEERALLQDMADEFHQRFIEHVQRARPAVTDSDIFDGRVITGRHAAELMLVDRIGYLDDAVEQARQLAKLPADAPLVMLRRDNDRAYTLLDVTPIAPTMSSLIPLKLPGL
ncbi:MAG: signal peptide peptidase SppA, partial [Aureliella sp.]